MRAFVILAVFSALAAPSLAMADDPNDPAMRTRAARERDRQIIRQLNLNQLAEVRERDARYAKGWAEWKSAGRGAEDARYAEATARHQRAQEDYARQRAAYERDMAEWRGRVAACRAGDTAACAE